MLLTLTTTHSPATDLGFLLHKNPARLHSFDFAFGKGFVFYPEATAAKCTAALLLEIDPIRLVRGQENSEGGLFDQYVNDRPYVASSFLSVALKEVFRTALTGKSKDRPELAAQAILLEAKLAVVPCRGGEKILRRLFEPLGYTLEIENYPLDETHSEWGDSNYFTVTLKATCRVVDLLSHIYVLIPVLDDDKHYWINEDEVTKLLRHGEGWLASHPDRELITGRYLRYRRFVKAALARLSEAEETATDPDEVEISRAAEEEAVEKPISLNETRLNTILALLKERGVKQVLDLGCGEGKLLQRLLADKSFERITGLDVSHRVLEMAKERLRFDELPTRQKERLTLLHGSLTYRDARLAGYQAACALEVIEHLDLSRLAALERTLFEFARPNLALVTTPNAEYNVKFENLPAGKMRHKDHRFEWTRAEFEAWGQKVAARYGYQVHFAPVGPFDSLIGAPTQLGVFSRE